MQNLKYGPYVTKQISNIVVVPTHIYNYGVIVWKPHKHAQKYPKPNKSTPNRHLLTNLTKLVPQQYIDLPAGADTYVPWEQIKLFASQCRRKGCQFRVAQQFVELPSGKRICRIWRIE